MVAPLEHESGRFSIVAARRERLRNTLILRPPHLSHLHAESGTALARAAAERHPRTRTLVGGKSRIGMETRPRGCDVR